MGWSTRRAAMVLVLLALSLPGWAEEEASLDELMSFYAEELVTTAAKSEQKQRLVSASVTVLNAEDIRMSGALSISDLLRLVPGIDSMVAMASDSSLGVRGFSDPIDQGFMVLVDGRTVYIDFIGSTFFESLPFSWEEVERIEIVRGPNSTLWGANAMSGVINIITRRPRAQAGTTVAGYAAELDTYGGSVVQAGQHGRVGYSLSLGYHTASFWDDPDEEALGVPRARGKVEVELPEGLLTSTISYTTLEGPVLSDLGPIDRAGSQGNLMVEYVRKGLTVRTFYTDTESDVLFGLLGEDAHVDAGTFSLDGFHTWDLQRSRLTVGAEYRRLTVDSELSGAGEVTQDLWSLYGQDTLRLGTRTELTLGLRYDAHPLTDPQVSPRAGVVFEPWVGHVLRLNYAEAFRNPSLTEFYLDTTVEIGIPIELAPNLDLQPEHLSTAELGYRFFREDRVSVDLTLFRNRREDAVLFNAVGFVEGTSVPNRFQFENTDRVRRGHGVELLLRGRMTERLSGSFAYTYQDVTIPIEGQEPEEWPEHKIAPMIRFVDPHGFEAQLWGQWVDRHHLEEGEIPSYTTVFAKVGYRFWDGRAGLYLFGQNLLDDEHREFPVGETLTRRAGLAFDVRF